ncbi:MAG: hypothetical protein ACK46I_04100 [Phycisphaerae bacterium]
MNTVDDDILTRRLDAMGRAMMCDAGPAPAAVVAASRATSGERATKWGYWGMAMAACLLIGFGAVAIWAAIRTNPKSATVQQGDVMAQQQPEQVEGDGQGDALANTGGSTNGNVAQTGNGTRDASVPTMGDLRGAVNDPVAGDPRVGGSLSPTY